MTSLVPSILNGSTIFLHTIRTTIKAWMSLNFGKIPLLTSELAALVLIVCKNEEDPLKIESTRVVTTFLSL